MFRWGVWGDSSTLILLGVLGDISSAGRLHVALGDSAVNVSETLAVGVGGAEGIVSSDGSCAT